MREYFEHFSKDTGAGKPFLITVCYLIDEETNLTRAIGFSLCSPSDQYNRKRGNTIARGRANKALDKQTNLSPVGEEIQKVLPVFYKGMCVKDSVFITG